MFNYVSLIDDAHKSGMRVRTNFVFNNFSFVQRHRCHRRFSKINVSYFPHEVFLDSVCCLLSRIYLFIHLFDAITHSGCVIRDLVCWRIYSPVDQNIWSHLILVDFLSFVDLFMLFSLGFSFFALFLSLLLYFWKSFNHAPIK